MMCQSYKTKIGLHSQAAVDICQCVVYVMNEQNFHYCKIKEKKFESFIVLNPCQIETKKSEGNSSLKIKIKKLYPQRSVMTSYRRRPLFPFFRLWQLQKWKKFASKWGWLLGSKTVRAICIFDMGINVVWTGCVKEGALVEHVWERGLVTWCRDKELQFRRALISIC